MNVASALAITFGLLLVGAAGMDGQEQSPSEPLVWQASVGPFTGNVRALAETDSGAVFAFVNGELHRSTDDGETWVRCPSQPRRPPPESNPFNQWLVAAGRHLYAAGDGARPMYVTEDDCESSLPVPLPPGIPDQPESVTTIDGVLIAAYHGGRVYTTPDNGHTWTSVALSIEPLGNPLRLARRGGMLFLVASLRLYRSTDRGGTWTPLASDGLAFHDVIDGGASLYATAARGGTSGIWRSRDEGLTWVGVLPESLTVIAARGERVYTSVFSPAATVSSADEGSTWSRGASPLPARTSKVLLETRRGTLLAGTDYGIFRSPDAGTRWTPTGMPGQRVLSLAAGKGRAYASMADGTLWTSEDAGLTWSRIGTMFIGNRPQLGWPYHFGRLFVVDGTQLRAGADRDFLASTDGGRTWSLAGLSKGVNALVRLRDTWYAATWDGVFRSDDLARWTECSNGLASGAVRSLTPTPEGDLITVQGHTVFRSQDECRSWWPLAMRVPALGRDGYVTGLQLFSDSAIGTVVFGNGIGQLSLTDGTWIVRAKTPFISTFVRDDRGRYWLGTREGVRRLSIAGPEWRLAPTGLDGAVAALAIDPSGYLMAAIDGRGVFRARLP